MRLRVAAVTVAVAVAGSLLAESAAAATATQPKRGKPGWYTSKVHKRVLRARARGLRVGDERLNTRCPGVQTRGVSAAGCIVAPAGCTANFIFGGPGNWHIGTAGHCVDRVGQELVMQVDTATLASVGTVVKRTDDGVGNDFALVKIDSAVASKWGVNPALPVGGPQGVYKGCGPVGVRHYGHGYGVAMGQGKPSIGLATNWNNDGYGWTGFALFGDSGSAVVTDSGQAAGNLTHLIVDTRDYPLSDVAGTRATRILQLAGLPLVNANGTTSGGGSTSCGASLRIPRPRLLR